MIQHAAPDDPRVLEYAHVGDHGWLTARGLFVAEGRLLLERLVAAGTIPIVSVLVTPAAARALETTLARVAGDVLVVDVEVMKAVTGFNFHRGCLALARRPGARRLEDLPGAGCLLGLEGVGNPDNVGGLVRTAAAFGVSGMLLDRTTGDPFYRKALRTSMGAALQMPFVRCVDWPAALGALQANGWMMAALTPEPAAEPLAAAAERLRALPARLLVVGTEDSGLSEVSLARADVRIRIPMSTRVDSLNVVVAAGIALARLHE